MNPTREHVTEFVERNAQHLRGDDLPELIALAHHNANGSQTPIGEWDLSAAVNDPEIRAALVMELLQLAHRHAQLLSGPQDYDLSIHWPRSETRPETIGASTRIRMAGAVQVGTLTPTEPANQAGLLSQLMRHLEAQARINAGLVERQTKMLGDELARKDRRIEQLELARSGQLDAIEQLALHQHERALEVMKAERTQRRMDDGLQSLKLLAPPMVAAISKRLGGPTMAAADPELLNLKTWLKSLSREQLLATLASSTPAQQAALMHAYQTLALADEPEFADLATTGGKPPIQ